jgi:uncharacterized protein (DUF362 family)
MAKRDCCNSGIDEDNNLFEDYEISETPSDFFEGEISRRDFFKTAGIAGLGAISLPLIGSATDVFAATSTISVVKGHSEAAIVEKAISLLGGMGAFVKRGDVVMIKPNIGWDRTYKQAANTNPFVIKKIIELCYSAGAKKVKVTDNPCQAASITFLRSGIKRACAQAGAELVFPTANKFKTVNIGGRVIKRWPVYKDIIECDRLINVPVAKHHSLSRLTLGMKNWYGAIGGYRGRLHQNIHAGIVDMARFFKPDLTIIDAVRIMQRNGPTGGSFRDVKKANTIIAGKDFVACDAYAATLFGLSADDIGYVKLAGSYGLGQSNLGRVRKLTANV